MSVTMYAMSTMDIRSSPKRLVPALKDRFSHKRQVQKQNGYSIGQAQTVFDRRQSNTKLNRHWTH